MHGYLLICLFIHYLHRLSSSPDGLTCAVRQRMDGFTLMIPASIPEY